jgi:hypothetical protein
LNSEKYNNGDADDYESAVRDAISLGGDPDTMACIAGGVAQAYYKKVPRPPSSRPFMKVYLMTCWQWSTDSTRAMPAGLLALQQDCPRLNS